MKPEETLKELSYDSMLVTVLMKLEWKPLKH